MYSVYLLENENGKWYVGYTPSDPFKRLKRHNDGKVQSTRAFRLWRLIYYEVYMDRADAVGREKFLKSGSPRNIEHSKCELEKYSGLPRNERSKFYAAP
ncbi:MAG: GIY-YIG nuclease family protein [Patescibacteria group bacterium]